MQFNVVGLPHTDPWDDFYSWCAYSNKHRRFVMMMRNLGHDVREFTGVTHSNYLGADIRWDIDHPMWVEMNARVAAELQDAEGFLCLIAGWNQKRIADLCPNLTPVEYGIGYQGIFAQYLVFESYAWMHSVYGSSNPGAMVMSMLGSPDAVVIPNSYSPDEFSLGTGAGDYLFYIGRLTERKGVGMLGALAEETGLKLIVAGSGDEELIPDNAEYVGVVGPEQRNELMGNARAVLVPTLYCEPFGGVHVEAQMCGTPVLTTNWGVFTETVTNGVNGYRCNYMDEFVSAAEKVKKLSRVKIRNAAIKRFSTDTVAKQYETYFKRINANTSK